MNTGETAGMWVGISVGIVVVLLVVAWMVLNSRPSWRPDMLPKWFFHASEEAAVAPEVKPALASTYSMTFF